jgi:hypothetical protein
MMRYVILALIALLWVVACNPVNKVMGDPDLKEDVTNRLLKEGICRPDTFLLVITDTVVTTDTVEHLYLTTDTIVNMDTVYITKTRWKDIIKTITIRDTLLKTIEDRAAIDALKDELIASGARLDQQKEKDTKMMMALAFVGLIVGIIISMAMRR